MMPRSTKKNKSGNETADANKKFFRYKHEYLQLKCDWSGCGEVFLDVIDHIFHVRKHIEHQQQLGDLNCHWEDCGYLAGCEPEFTVHVNFHAFHTKIKCIGANIVARKKLTGCSLDSQHRNLVPELPKNLTCEWTACKEVTFDNPELYYRHVSEHAIDVGGGDQQCRWESCTAQFAAAFRLQEHLRAHTQEKLIACPNCGNFFSNRTKFLDHLKRQIPVEEKKYRCSHCSKMLASERLLRDHMKNHINSYKCPFCDMTCSNPSNLSTHIKYRHSDERPYGCNFCDYKAKSQTDLYKHLKGHMPTPQNVCHHKGCIFSSRTSRALRQHLKKKHGESATCGSYICHLCKKEFQRGTYLTHHLMKVHDFRWPSGHCRFRYKQNDDGTRQLQTVRYESIELTQEMIDQDVNDSAEVDIDDSKEVDVDDSVEVDADDMEVQEDVEIASENVNREEVLQLIEVPDCGAVAAAIEEGQVVILAITGSDGVTRNIQFVSDENA